MAETEIFTVQWSFVQKQLSMYIPCLEIRKENELLPSPARKLTSNLKMDKLQQKIPSENPHDFQGSSP